MQGFSQIFKRPAQHDRRVNHESPSFIPVYSGLNCFPSLLDIIGNRGFIRNFRNSSLFAATCKNSGSARGVSAANHVGKGADGFRKPLPI